TIATRGTEGRLRLIRRAHRAAKTGIEPHRRCAIISLWVASHFRFKPRNCAVVSVLPQICCSSEGTAFLVRALAPAMQISDARTLRVLASVRQWHLRRRDMGEVIDFKRTKLAGFIPEQDRPP